MQEVYWAQHSHQSVIPFCQNFRCECNAPTNYKHKREPTKADNRHMIIENFEVTHLPNGVRVVSETVPYVQSVSIGIWVGVGSRDEVARVRGVTHFIEHMLF